MFWKLNDLILSYESDQQTRRPSDQQTRRPSDQKTLKPEDQKTRRPEDLGDLGDLF